MYDDQTLFRRQTGIGRLGTGDDGIEGLDCLEELSEKPNGHCGLLVPVNSLQVDSHYDNFFAAPVYSFIFVEKFRFRVRILPSGYLVITSFAGPDPSQFQAEVGPFVPY